MLFSEHYGVSTSSRQEWFDPILNIDTRLFLDPFLIFAQERGVFVGSHAEIIAFFNSIYGLIARSGGVRSSPYWLAAQNNLVLHEVEELCLGYTAEGTGGRGGGVKLAAVVADAVWEAIQAGLTSISHFEEVSILRKFIGADRISDITGNLIRWRIARYTEAICRRNNIPVHEHRYLRGKYDTIACRWQPLVAQLPNNPHNRKPLMLLPRRYLRALPTINAEDFWHHVCANDNEVLRTELNMEIASRVDRDTIIAFARRHPEIRNRYLRAVESRPAIPYDLTRDTAGVYGWYKAGQEFAAANPLDITITNQTSFIAAVRKIVLEYRTFVEHNGGWSLLWNDDRSEKPESAAQLLLTGIVMAHCRAYDIDISKEANIGRGPVDFKFSRGYRNRVLLEVKKASNSAFWNGLERQLPTYMTAEGVTSGLFLVIILRDKDLSRMGEIQERLNAVSAQTGYEIEVITVNGMRNPPSGSRA